MTHRRPRVLIADDHPGLAKAICRTLALDYEIAGIVEDGGAVLEAAQRLQPDVIVLDLSLPNVNGMDVCRQITQENPKMKVVVFTVMDGPHIRQLSIDVGASAFVCKVAFDCDLLATINRLCAGRD